MEMSGLSLFLNIGAGYRVNIDYFPRYNRVNSTYRWVRNSENTMHFIVFRHINKYLKFSKSWKCHERHFHILKIFILKILKVSDQERHIHIQILKKKLFKNLKNSQSGQEIFTFTR